jgi:hypothetical protein
MRQIITLPSYEARTTTANGWQFPYIYTAILLGGVVTADLVSNHILYYQRLAEAFLQGRFDVPMIMADLAPYKGRNYYPDGPLPAILMMPFAALGISAPIALAANLGVFYLCFLLARRFDYSPIDSCWLALAFCFGTSMIGIMFTSAGIAHSLTVLLQFLAIVEYEGKRRYPLIGLYIGSALLGHAPAGLNIIVFGLITVLRVEMIREKAVKLISLGLPFAVIVGLLALYNYTRFDNPFESGYSYQINYRGIPFAELATWGNIPGPALSLANIPTNLQVFLFGLPDFWGIGSSVFILSPFAIYLLTLWRWDTTNTLIILNVLVVLTAVLSFRSTGFQQVGYRFSLDFLPFIFWLAVRSGLHMTRGLKAMIFVATLTDLGLVIYFVMTRLTPPA